MFPRWSSSGFGSVRWGGAIPLEAQRLGLTSLSGDLNPVAVLIQKAMVDIPARFAGCRSVHPDIDTSLLSSDGRAAALAADVEAYGKWMRDEAERRIGDFYPHPTTGDGSSLTPIAWIWARTVESPDPSWSGHVPLVASWILSNKPNKPNKPLVWVEPIVDRESQSISYVVREGGEPSHPQTVTRGVGTCVATGATITGDYIKTEARAGRMSAELIAVVADSRPGRQYLTPTNTDRQAAAGVGEPAWRPVGQLHPNPNGGDGPLGYGMTEYYELFSRRQLLALTTFSDLLADVWDHVERDAIARGMDNDGRRLRDGGDGACAYADAVVTYLAFVVDKCADYWATTCTWHNSRELVRNTFGRAVISMTWDYAEANPFSTSTGSWMSMVTWVRKAIAHLPAHTPGKVVQRDALTRIQEISDTDESVVVSTDPPYYDMISFADISDFFYVWLRHNVAEIWPDECATILTPKTDELIAHQFRAGSEEKAKDHFTLKMAEFMSQLAACHTLDVPATIYYAYKATETADGRTGWDTFLQAMIDAGLQVTATWPVRTEAPKRPRSLSSNALDTAIVLACRPLTDSAGVATRGEFLAALRSKLPEAVKDLQSGKIGPVDLPQATIGPGIAIFSRYSKVVETDGKEMSVSTALSTINTVLAEIVYGETAHIDPYSRFAIDWYGEYGYESASSGGADRIARARNTSVDGVCQSGIATTRSGKFRLYTRTELETNNPDRTPTDERFTIWEATQRLIAAHQRSEIEAAGLLRTVGGDVADNARNLAYVLYDKAATIGLNDDAVAYNDLVNAWAHLHTIRPDTQLFGFNAAD